jgi:flagellar motility protein MotE (MotC chaperone)
MDERLKLLPTVAVCSALLFLLKGISLWTGVETALLAPTPAVAGESKADKGNADQKDDAHETHGEEHSEGAEDHGDAADHSEAAPDSAKARPKSRAEAAAEFYDEPFMSKSEIRVLQSLSDRREQIDARERELATREKLLEAAEKKVEARIAELKTIEASIEQMLEIRDEKEEEQIRSLVKVYENMKAKDAARIFESLDETILIAVMGRMREAKMADILAKMKPSAAQNLTVRLATQTRPDAGQPE